MHEPSSRFHLSGGIPFDTLKVRFVLLKKCLLAVPYSLQYKGQCHSSELRSDLGGDRRHSPFADMAPTPPHPVGLGTVSAPNETPLENPHTELRNLP